MGLLSRFFGVDPRREPLRWKREEGAGRAGGADAGSALPPGILERVRLLEVRARELVDTVFSGEYHSIFKGRGIEFSEVREYQVGDDVRTIDWNVTARRGHPYVKRFVEERELNVVLLVDLSASEHFGTGAKSNREVAVEIASLLALSAVRNNDRVGLLLCTDRVERFVPPASGRRHVLRLILDLMRFEPRSRGTDLTHGLEYVARAFRHRSVVFVISDFVLPEPTPARVRNLVGRLSVQHDLVPVRLGDPGGETLPNLGWMRLVDPETSAWTVVNSGSASVRERYRDVARERRAAVMDMFNRAGVDILEVDTRTDYVAPLVSYFRRRARVAR